MDQHHLSFFDTQLRNVLNAVDNTWFPNTAFQVWRGSSWRKMWHHFGMEIDQNETYLNENINIKGHILLHMSEPTQSTYTKTWKHVLKSQSTYTVINSKLPLFCRCKDLKMATTQITGTQSVKSYIFVSCKYMYILVC